MSGDCDFDRCGAGSEDLSRKSSTLVLFHRRDLVTPKGRKEVGPGFFVTMEKEKRKNMLQELDKAMRNGEHDRGVKMCNKLLHSFPDDELAFRCKIICCIQLGRIADAITFMDKNPKLITKLGYERAYCFYRNQDMESAKSILDEVEDSPAKQELMTQILYRMEMYDEAYNVCKELVRVTEDDYDEERQTNLAAINACLIGAGHGRRLDKVAFDTHELRYNMACALIAEERYQDALKVLKEAENKAGETLREDGLTEEEILEDTAIISIQSAYCTQKLGRDREAMAMYSKVLRNKPPEPDLVAVASNNILCVNKEQNIFDSKKRIKAMRAEGADAKLTKAQRRDMYLNQCLFYLLTGQLDLCKETCTLMSSKFPESSHEIFLIQTALIIKTEGVEAAKKFVAPALKDPETTLQFNLCFVQQLLRDGKRNEAISILEELAKNSYRPGIIGALVTLYQQEGRVNDAATTVKKAVDFYRKKEGNKKRLNILWRQAASLMMQQGDLAEAIKSLEELRKSSPDDITTLAQLIVAYAQYDISKAHKLSRELPTVPPPEDLDMATLESPNWLASVKLARKTKPDSVPSTPQVAAVSSEEDKKKPSKKKKGKCKSKMPKEVDPERKPDPERWLPKYERAGYRPKKQRRGKQDVGKGTQGADSATSAIYDMSTKMKKESSTPSSPASPAVVKQSGKSKKKSK